MNFRILAGTFRRPEPAAGKRRLSARRARCGAGAAVVTAAAPGAGWGREVKREPVPRVGRSAAPPALRGTRKCSSASRPGLKLVGASSAEEYREKPQKGTVNVCATACVKNRQLFSFFFCFPQFNFYKKFKKVGSVIVSFVPVVAAGGSTSWVYLRLSPRLRVCFSSIC